MFAPASASARTTAFPMPLLPPVTMATLPVSVVMTLPLELTRFVSMLVGPPCPGRCRGAAPSRADRSSEALGEVLAHTDTVGHRREGRVHGADAREEAGVDDVEVVDLVGLAVRIEHGRGGVGPEPV